MSNLPTRIRTARKALKISQEEAAQRCGVRHNTFCRWETGRMVPSAKNWPAIEALLGPMPCPYCGSITNPK